MLKLGDDIDVQGFYKNKVILDQRDEEQIKNDQH